MQFRLNIAFAEPKIVCGNPVVETLHEMTKMIRHMIFEFDKWGLFRAESTTFALGSLTSTQTVF